MNLRKLLFGVSSSKNNFNETIKRHQLSLQKSDLDCEVYFHSAPVEGSFDNLQIKIADELLLLKGREDFFFFKEKELIFHQKLDDQDKKTLQELVMNLFARSLDGMLGKLKSLAVTTPPLALPTEQKNLKWLELTTEFSLKALSDLEKDSTLLPQTTVFMKEKNEGALIRIKSFNIDYLFELDQEKQYVVTVFDHKMGDGEPLLKLDYAFFTLLRPSFNCAIQLIEKTAKHIGASIKV